MLRDDEAAEIEGELREALAQARLQWVLDQIDEAIADGVVEVLDTPKDRDTFGKVEALSRGSLNRRRTERTRPYTAGERVQLFVEAMRRAVVETAALEARVTATLAEVAGTTDIAFLSAPDEQRRGFAVPSPRRAQTDELARVLDELESETSA